MEDKKAYYHNCIVCGEKSDGKPQCFYCWAHSANYIEEEELHSNLFSNKEYEKEYDCLLKEAYNAKTQKTKQEICNQIIALGLYAKQSYGTIKNSQFLLKKAYDDVIDLLKYPTKEPNFFTHKKEISNDIDPETNKFRKKFPAEYHCIDGHYVRSQTEREIDNFLHIVVNLPHTYEPKFRLNEEEKIICRKENKDYNCFYPDFYIPKYNLYIEYFGLNDEKYNQKMDLKIKILSNRKNINFIYLTNKNINTLLDDLADLLTQLKNKL